jgi:hypothetical protein
VSTVSAGHTTEVFISSEKLLQDIIPLTTFNAIIITVSPLFQNKRTTKSKIFTQVVLINTSTMGRSNWCVLPRTIPAETSIFHTNTRIFNE